MNENGIVRDICVLWAVSSDVSVTIMAKDRVERACEAHRVQQILDLTCKLSSPNIKKHALMGALVKRQ